MSEPSIKELLAAKGITVSPPQDGDGCYRELRQDGVSLGYFRPQDAVARFLPEHRA